MELLDVLNCSVVRHDDSPGAAAAVDRNADAGRRCRYQVA